MTHETTFQAFRQPDLCSGRAGHCGRSVRPAGRTCHRSTLEAELIYGDANTVQKFSLDNDATYDVDTGYYTVHIEVKDGAARFVDSPCPDHICESFGWLSAEDQTATCLPARAVLTIAPLS